MSGHGSSNNANQIAKFNRERKIIGGVIGGSIALVGAIVIWAEASQQDPSHPVMHPAEGTTPAATAAPTTTVTTTETTPPTTTTTTIETTTTTQDDKFRGMAELIAKQITNCDVSFFSASGPSQLKFDTTYQVDPRATDLIAQLQAHPDPNLTLYAPRLELQSIDAQGNRLGDPVHAKDPLSDSNIVNKVVSRTPAYIVEVVDSVGVHEANQPPYTVTDKIGCYAIAWDGEAFRPYNEASHAFDTSAIIGQHITTEG